jgi:hypothetical protein
MMHTCMFCEIKFPTTSNYAKHLRYYGGKPEGKRKGHPAIGTPDFDDMKKLLNMRDMPEGEEDEEKEKEAKLERRSERNRKHYVKKLSKKREVVQKQILLAV